ncbi:MAG TPA: hypothetical protein VFT48_21365 [Pyrinomonadaceae bacterium]|nr:hypothetical protein [Pyrinomonadaceae bacterium]
MFFRIQASQGSGIFSCALGNVVGAAAGQIPVSTTLKFGPAIYEEETAMHSINWLKRAALLTLALSVALAQLSLSGQTRRTGTRTRPTQTAPPTTATQPQQGGTRPTVELVRPPKAMAAAFESGKLPEPARLPAGTVEERAAELAKAVSKADSSSTAAFFAAVLASGYGVRDPDGSVLQTVQPGQGFAFRASEVAALAKMYGERRMVDLTYLCAGLKAIPELKEVPLENILLDGIRKHAQDGKSPLHFWARFIVELGLQRDEPSNMLGDTDPKKVRLDAIQAGLILRRLAFDFYGFAQRDRQASARSGAHLVGSAQRRRANEPQNPLFIRAGLHDVGSPRFVKAVATEAVEPTQRVSPCPEYLEGDAPIALDATAILLTTGWEKLLKYLQAQDIIGDRYAKFVKIFNILSTYAKFVVTYAMLETEIDVKDPPLVRTTTTMPGGERRLIAKVSMNTGGFQDINCLRNALNVFTGLDVSLLKDGPLEGVEVNWHLIEGVSQGIVGFKNEGPRIQDPGAYAGIPGQGGTPVQAIPRTKTDKDGAASICLQGKPHVPYVGQPRLAVIKRAVVMTTIRMKAGEIKGDAVDVAGQALGGVAGLLTLPAELLYRTDWASTAWLDVYVKDWQECDRGWYGKITVALRFNETKDNMPNGPDGWNLSNTTEVIKEFEYNFNLTGEADTSQGFQNGYFADAQININDSTIQVSKQREAGFCDTGSRHPNGGKITVKVNGTSTYTNSRVKAADGTARATVYIAQRGAAGYNILIEPPSSPVEGTEELKRTFFFPQCPLWERVRSEVDEPPRPRPFYLPRIEFLATFDPNNRGIVSGSLSKNDPNGGTITYTWDLKMCGTYEDKRQSCN